MPDLSFLDATKWHAKPDTYRDKISEFCEAARQFGLDVSSPVMDGEVHRVRDISKSKHNTNGWYVLHADGDLMHGAFGSWSSGNGMSTWCSHSPSEVTPADKAKIEKHRADSQAKIDAARMQAAQTATAIIDNALPAPNNHPYLVNKGVKPHGIKIFGENLLIPLTKWSGEIATYQTIAPDGSKLFLPGGGKGGSFFVFGGQPQKDDLVYICEGWATAASIFEAANKPTICAIDAGNLLPVAKGFRELFNNHLVVCADNDDNNAGDYAAQKVIENVTNCSVISPTTKDFNDLHQQSGLDAVRKQLGIERKYLIDLSEWTADAYEGSPPDIKWLAQDSLPLGVPGIAASVGGLGKSFMCLDACLAVAAPTIDDTPIFGGKIVEHGRSIFLTSEDSKDSVHRRLAGIDPYGSRRRMAGSNMAIVPIPSAGGVQHLVSQDKNGINKTRFYNEIKAQLIDIKPKLVIFDPLQAFTSADINSDPAAGQYVYNCLSELCAETGATVLMMHHMNKDGLKGVADLTEARAGIRGTSALVDGSRWSYALWPATPEENKMVCESFQIPVLHQRIVFGGVVKANDKCNQVVRKYVRLDNGLLQDRTEAIDDILRQGKDRAGISQELEQAIIEEVGRRYTSVEQPAIKRGEIINMMLINDIPKDVANMAMARFDSGVKIMKANDGYKLPHQ